MSKHSNSKLQKETRNFRKSKPGAGLHSKMAAVERLALVVAWTDKARASHAA